MDALEILKNDHQLVRLLFNDFEATDSLSQRKMLVDRVRAELESHMRVEESIFYPAFKNYPEFEGILRDSYGEHQKVKDLFGEIRSTMNSDPPHFLQLVQELRREFDHHVESEEQTMFPMVRKIMKRPERENLGRHIEASKSEQVKAA